ncbi:MAG: tetratricopeptide repeat protein, partial [Clostridia bacterium]|nr:tetratricopeptide repeat protein [Clostridia bacterium]
MDIKNKIKYYTRLIDELSRSGSTNELFWAYFERGLYYLEDYEYELAISDFTEAASINPNEPSVYFNIGFAYSKMKVDDLAEEYFKKVIEIDSKNPFAYFELGNLNYNRQNYEDAVEYYTKAIKNGKRGSDTYYKRAMTNFKLLKYIEALSDISYAIKIKPTNLDYYVLRSNIYISLRDYKSAIEDLSYLVNIKPSHSVYRLNRAIVYATCGSLIKLFINDLIPLSFKKIVEKTISSFGNDYNKYYKLAGSDINIVIEQERKLFGDYYISPSYYITRGAILLSYGKKFESIIDFSFAKIILRSYFSLNNKTYQLMKALVDLYLDNYKESLFYIENNYDFNMPKVNILRACWWWK